MFARMQKYMKDRPAGIQGGKSEVVGRLSFLLLLQHVVTNLVVSNNANVSFYSSVDWKSNTGLTGLTARCQQGCAPFWRRQGRICFLTFPSFQKPHTWLMAPFLHFQSQQNWVKFSVPHGYLCCFRDLGVDAGPTQILQYNLPVKDS